MQYTVYNAVLRQFAEDEVFKKYERHENLFTTTISVLVSAVQKLSRVGHIPEGTLLYRGLGGKHDLPEGFFVADRVGARGFTEWGFTSTSSDMNVAVQYSGVRERAARPMVMVTKSTAVDRGACIRDYSQ